MSDELIKKLIELMENISPAVWAIVLRQAWVNGITNFVTALFFVAAAVGFLKLFQHARKEAEDESYSDWNMVAIISAVVAGGAVVGAFAFAMAAVSTILNPNYYAIQILLGLVK